MTETEFEIDTTAPYKIDGLFNKNREGETDKLIIIAHGLTGYLNEFLYLMAARYFSDNGFDVARISFYSGNKHARKFKDVTLKDHVVDLQKTIAHFKGSYKKIFVCGHSYGGMTAVMLNPDITAVSLWDSSLYPYTEYWERETEWSDEFQTRVYDYGYPVIIGKEMYEDAKNLTFEVVSEAASKMKAPTQLVVAGKHAVRPGQQKIFEYFPEPKKYTYIQNADHCFTSGNSVEFLFDETHLWFDEF